MRLPVILSTLFAYFYIQHQVMNKLHKIELKGFASNLTIDA